MKRILAAFLFATLAYLPAAFLSPVVAQIVVSPIQNATPLAPSVTGSDQSHGIYFGTNRTGISGHLEGGSGSGSTPALSACGTGTLATGSTDFAGEFTATGATGCTLTFGTAFAVAPSCVVTEETINTAARTTTVTASTLVVAAGGSGSKYSYMCVAKSGG